MRSNFVMKTEDCLSSISSTYLCRTLAFQLPAAVARMVHGFLPRQNARMCEVTVGVSVV